MIARTTALLLSLTLWLGVGLGAASACSCEQAPANVRGHEQHQAWQFSRASNVVRGKIVSIRAGEGVARDDRGVVLVTMRVSAVVKGDVPTGNVTIVTAASSSCGLGGPLLMAAETGNEMSLELISSETPGFTRLLPGEFHVSYCGYFRFGSDPNLSR